MALQLSTGKLAGKKSPNKEGKGAELPSQAQEISAADDEGDGYVDCQNPLWRKSANSGSPISEGDIDNKNQNCDYPQWSQMP